MALAVSASITALGLPGAQTAWAQTSCTIPAGNGGVVQNGPPACTVGDIAVGFGTAITATNSADVTTNGSVLAQGFGTGIDASGNSLVSVNGFVTASGLGLSASSGARIEANGIVLSNDGGGGAIALSANNGTIIARGVSVNWPSGGGQSLVQALGGGLIQFTPGSSIINTNGGIPSALLGDGTGSRIVSDGLLISLGGAGGITGALAQNGGALSFTGNSRITFAGGGGSTGIAATGAGSAITAQDLSITINNGNGNDVGASAAAGGQIQLNGGAVTVTGTGGGERGLRSTDPGSLISATGTTISINGGGGSAGVNALNGAGIVTSGGSVSVVNGPGGLIESGGRVSMSGTGVTASGNGGFGFQFGNGGTNLLRYDNGTISASLASFSVQGATGDMILNGATAVTNNNTLLETNGGGTTLFVARGSTLRGMVTTPPGNTSSLVLSQSSLWTMTGSSTATNLANANSQIVFTPPTDDATQLASYKTLTVSNYIGRGGSLNLNTYLGADSSPSDRLVINGGRASGSSSLFISNTIGPGDLTQGSGILVVDATNGGTTNQGAFFLGRPVVAGPYEYALIRGSVDGSGPQNWYLRSDGAVPPDPFVPPGPDPGPEPSPGPDPDPGPPPAPSPVPPPSPTPNYRREVSLYTALPSMALIYGRTIIDSLHERVGERGSNEPPSVIEQRYIWCKDPSMNFRCTTKVQLPASAVTERSYASPGWARIIGSHGTRDNGVSGIFRDGPNFDYDIYALQAGLDIYRGMNADGSRDHVGIYGVIGRLQGDVKHFTGIKAGTNTIDGYSLGAYWTHFGASGWYLDGVIQGTWYDVEADSKRLISLKREAFGIAASLEGGYPIHLGNGWLIEPQAQLIYQTQLNGSGHDGAALVRFSDVDSLAGRLGARLAKSWTLEEATPQSRPRMMIAWLKASLWNEFLGSPKTSFSSATGFIPFRSDLGGAWAEVKVGVDAAITRNTALYASAGYSVGFDGRSHAYDGRVGIKVTW
jgi:outer membrane autotransporter protein